MLLRKFLVVVLMFTCSTVIAQDTKNQPPSRLLKTGSSLMEAQQFDAAEEYFKKGLQKAVDIYDYYNQALAYEDLGNLYTKTDQTDSAVTAYRKAIKLYRAQKLTVVADVVESLLKSVQGIGDLYAGVEIGAKGIK